MKKWRIRKISPQKKDSSRVNVDFGDFVLGFSLFLVRKNHLSEGGEISLKQLKTLWKKEIKEKLKNKALSLLGRRPRSEKEITQRLHRYFQKSHLAEKLPFLEEKEKKVVEEVVKFLKKRGLLGDKEFCRWWLQQRVSFRPRSLKEIFQELRRKGIARKVIEEVFQEEDFSEEEALKKIILKKKTSWRRLGKKKGKNRAFRYLLGRGFSYSMVKSLIDEMKVFQ